MSANRCQAPRVCTMSPAGARHRACAPCRQSVPGTARVHHVANRCQAPRVCTMSPIGARHRACAPCRQLVPGTACVRGFAGSAPQRRLTVTSGGASLRRMVSVWLQDRDLVFLHVPKTAGGSISRALLEEPDAVNLGVRDMSVAVPCVETTPSATRCAVVLAEDRDLCAQPVGLDGFGLAARDPQPTRLQRPAGVPRFLDGSMARRHDLAVRPQVREPRGLRELSHADHAVGSSRWRRGSCRHRCRLPFRETWMSISETCSTPTRPLDTPTSPNGCPTPPTTTTTHGQVVAERNQPLIERFGYEFDESR